MARQRSGYGIWTRIILGTPILGGVAASLIRGNEAARRLDQIDPKWFEPGSYDRLSGQINALGHAVVSLDDRLAALHDQLGEQSRRVEQRLDAAAEMVGTEMIESLMARMQVLEEAVSAPCEGAWDDEIAVDDLAQMSADMSASLLPGDTREAA